MAAQVKIVGYLRHRDDWNCGTNNSKYHGCGRKEQLSWLCFLWLQSCFHAPPTCTHTKNTYSDTIRPTASVLVLVTYLQVERMSQAIDSSGWNGNTLFPLTRIKRIWQQYTSKPLRTNSFRKINPYFSWPSFDFCGTLVESLIHWQTPFSHSPGVATPSRSWASCWDQGDCTLCCWKCDARLLDPTIHCTIKFSPFDCRSVWSQPEIHSSRFEDTVYWLIESGRQLYLQLGHEEHVHSKQLWENLRNFHNIKLHTSQRREPLVVVAKLHQSSKNWAHLRPCCWYPKKPIINMLLNHVESANNTISHHDSSPSPNMIQISKTSPTAGDGESW